VLGVLLSFWGIRLFVALAPQWFARAEEISVDAAVLGFTLGISLLTGVLFGLAPALRASKPDLNESLKEGGRRSRGGSRHRSHSLLVISEVALALVLLVGASLMINSFLRLQRVDPGFNPDKLLTAEILLEGSKYWHRLAGSMKRVTPQGAIFYERLLERVRPLPGVKSADIISSIQWMYPAPDQLPRAGYNEISPGFFGTMSIPLLKGRYLTERDVEGSPWVVIINESMARQFFPDEDPVGKMLHMTIYQGTLRPVREENPREIVGVVGDVRQRLASDPAPAMYGPYRQHLWEFPGGQYMIHLGKNLVIRTGSEPMSLATAVRRVVSEVDNDQAVYDIMTMEDRLSESLAPWRFQMRLYGIFAGLAVTLAAVGIFGVMSYSVSQRTHEFGIRMALGAHRGDVLKLVMKRGLVLALIGVAIGVAVALGLTRLIASELYGVTPTDPVTFTAVALVLVGVALLASYIPARRATKVDPLVALRHE
jgi:putative ABC transport system permease protein